METLLILLGSIQKSHSNIVQRVEGGEGFPLLADLPPVSMGQLCGPKVGAGHRSSPVPPTAATTIATVRPTHSRQNCH